MMGSRANGKSPEEEEDEEEDKEEGVGVSDTAGECAVVSVAGNKTKMHLASSLGLLTEFMHARNQASHFRELDLTVHNALRYNFEMNRQSDSGSPHTGLPLPALDDLTVLALLQDLWAKVDAIVAQRRIFPWGNRGGGQLSARRQLDPLVFFQKMQDIWSAIRDLFESAAKRLGATEETMDVDVEESPVHPLEHLAHALHDPNPLTLVIVSSRLHLTCKRFFFSSCPFSSAPSTAPNFWDPSGD